MALYTIHERPGRDLEAVRDGKDLLAFFAPPVWAVWNGLWLTLLGMTVLTIIVAAISPFGLIPFFYGLSFVVGLEGAEILRLERRAFGWREVGAVDAETPEGAEELYLAGHAA
ncbi:MAG: DUF2628 domain-containing protein [Pseudomonadota bacterium]